MRSSGQNKMPISMNSALQGARILVIDDNLDFVRTLREVVEAEGASLAAAFTAKEALKLAATSFFDAVLMDIRLPDVLFEELIRQISVLGRGVEIIMLSGNASMEEAIHSLSIGAYSYLLRPIDPFSLQVELSRAIRQTRSTREIQSLKLDLDRSEAGLGTLVNTVHALLLVLDDKGIVVQANQAAADTVGLPIEALIGDSWLDRFVHEDDRPETLTAFRGLFEREGPITMQSRVVRPKQGEKAEVTWVRWRATALHDESGRVHVYASGLDMSDTRELERRAHLTEKLAAVGTLSAGLAHEIRNPLNAAGLQLRLLNRRLGASGADAQLLEPVALVQEELARLSRLVGEFLQFARPTGLVRSRVDVAALADSVVRLEAPAAMERSASIEISLPAGPVLLEGDAEKLRQVVLNLIRNAVDAAGKGGRVEVGVEARREGIDIWVLDDGDGISEEDSSRIFEPFYSTKPGGTGLGMSIVHSLVTLHGGHIMVESSPGEGTKVIVSLPAVLQD